MLQTCADGYFLSGSSCQKCSSLCQNCEAESTICTSCPPGGYILDNSRCKTQNQIRDEAIPTFRLILLLSICVAGIVLIVQNSLALAFQFPPGMPQLWVRVEVIGPGPPRMHSGE